MLEKKQKFNLSTTINYSVPERRLVTLKIYDILGKEVETLFQGDSNAGQFQVIFNAKNMAAQFIITGSGQLIW